MKYVKLGTTGMEVSKLCLGTMTFGWSADKETSHKILNRAHDLGINFLDTANMYVRKFWDPNVTTGQSEKIIGEYLEKSQSRNDWIIATKVRGNMEDGFGPDKLINSEGLSRRHIRMQIKGSLERLRTDWIDLYQAHFPDPSVPIKDTLSAFTDLVHEGKVHATGVSNMSAWKLVESILIALHNDLEPFRTLQPDYALTLRKRFEGEISEVVDKYKLGVLSYSAIASGFLTKKYSRGKELPDTIRAKFIHGLSGIAEQAWVVNDMIREIGAEQGSLPSQIALAWVLTNPLITTPIIGVNSISQLESNIGSLDIELTRDQKNRLDEVSKGLDIPVWNRWSND